MIIKQAPTGHGSDWMPSKCLSVWLLTNCLKAFPKVECINHTYVGAKHFLCVFIILFGKYLIKWWYRHMLVNGERKRERERDKRPVLEVRGLRGLVRGEPFTGPGPPTLTHSPVALRTSVLGPCSHSEVTKGCMRLEKLKWIFDNTFHSNQLWIIRFSVKKSGKLLNYIYCKYNSL